MTNEDHCGVCDKMRYDYIENNAIKIQINMVLYTI